MSSNKKVIILGSARSHGDTRKIVDFIREEVPMDLVDLNNKKISYYDYHHKNQSDDYIPLMESLVQYSTILLATPVYWYSMSAPMKTFFDRFSDLVTIRKDLGRALQGKTLASISCSGNENLNNSFSMPFRETAQYLDMHYKGHLHAWLENQEIPQEVNSRIKAFLL
ncbi:MAG: flavodoxin family protein [Cyclobacteriaceae bacterium]